MLSPPCSQGRSPGHHALAAMLSGPCSQGHALTAMCTPVRWTRCTPARCTLGSFITANQQNLEGLYSCKLDSGQGGSDLEDPKEERGGKRRKEEERGGKRRKEEERGGKRRKEEERGGKRRKEE